MSGALCALALLAVAPPSATAQDGSSTGTEPPAALNTLPETLGDAIGLWDLSLDGSNRRCELTLSGDSGPNGRVLRFPAGCRRALPVLANAAGWLFAARGIRIVDGNIRPLLELYPRPDARSLSGRTEGGEAYSLVPLGTMGMLPAPETTIPEAKTPEPKAPEPKAPEPKASEAAASEAGAPELRRSEGQAPPPAADAPVAEAMPRPVPPPASARAGGLIPDVAVSRGIPGSQPVLRSDVLVRPGEAGSGNDGPAPRPGKERAENPPPGVFALDRFVDKDVCRIELAPRKSAGVAGKEPAREVAPARILPGCRDDGIAVFEPVSWRFASGHLTLKAKRGHAVNLVPTGDGRWRRDPEVGTTFILRKIEP